MDERARARNRSQPRRAASIAATSIFLIAVQPGLNAQVKGDSPFAELIGWIHSNLDAPLDVPSLAARACLSERTFHRKFVAATGETPARLVETARLDTARMLLTRGLSLKSVAAQVGLFPPARFT